MENWKDINEEEEWVDKTACHFVFYQLGSIDSKCHAGISEHFYHQRHIYLFWLSKQSVCD
jgi:hypothetical protein